MKREVHSIRVGTASARWQRAYKLALMNSMIFLLLSVLSLAAGVHSITVNAVISLLFMAGSLATGMVMIFVAQGPVPIGMYVLGTGITFGFGTALAAMAPPLDYLSMLLFSHDVAVQSLGKINLLNSISIFVVVCAAWPFSRLAADAKAASGGVATTVNAVARFRGVLLLGSLAVVGLLFATYPIPVNLVLRSVVFALAKVPLVTIVVLAARWRSQPAYAKVSLMVITTSLVAFGLLSASKANTLLPVAAIIGGLWLNAGSRKAAIGLGVLTAAAYFVFVAPLSERMRNMPTYDGGLADLSTSALNLATAIQQKDGDPAAPQLRFVQRFSTTPYQAYLIRQYDDGYPGQSLRDVWTAMVPRMLWPEKPNITRFGAQLYTDINRFNGTSQLSPTYSAEAYWNFGWGGLLLVSLVIGLEMGWFTRKWLHLEFRQGDGPGILVFIVPVVLMAMFPEAWIAATYVGGFLTLVILISATDWIAGKLGVMQRIPVPQAPARA